jgi:hypothetical protein
LDIELCLSRFVEIELCRSSSEGALGLCSTAAGTEKNINNYYFSIVRSIDSFIMYVLIQSKEYYEFA